MRKFIDCSLISLAITISIVIAVLMSSCNLTRVVTTTAQHYVHGDTTTTIMTKTTESYDGSIQPDLIKR